MQNIKISPSILSADFAHLGRDIEYIVKSGADMIHVDIMDGYFVPNITMGHKTVNAIRKCSNGIMLDIHLMTQHPENFIHSFAAHGDILTIHYETICDNPYHIIRNIKSLGCIVGVALSPQTPPSAITPLLDHINLVLVMTVNPGFSGQGFMYDQLSKIRQISKIIGDRDILIEVDGGINDITAPQAIDAGAQILVSGSYLFDNSENELNMSQKIQLLRGVSTFSK